MNIIRFYLLLTSCLQICLTSLATAENLEPLTLWEEAFPNQYESLGSTLANEGLLAAGEAALLRTQIQASQSMLIAGRIDVIQEQLAVAAAEASNQRYVQMRADLERLRLDLAVQKEFLRSYLGKPREMEFKREVQRLEREIFYLEPRFRVQEAFYNFDLRYHRARIFAMQLNRAEVTAIKQGLEAKQRGYSTGFFAALIAFDFVTRLAVIGQQRNPGFVPAIALTSTFFKRVERNAIPDLADQATDGRAGR